jgi:hypothetical protein
MPPNRRERRRVRAILANIEDALEQSALQLARERSLDALRTARAAACLLKLEEELVMPTLDELVYVATRDAETACARRRAALDQRERALEAREAAFRVRECVLAAGASSATERAETSGVAPI